MREIDKKNKCEKLIKKCEKYKKLRNTKKLRRTKNLRNAKNRTCTSPDSLPASSRSRLSSFPPPKMFFSVDRC